MGFAQIIIPGFPSTDFVPGAYGVVKYGAGSTSAASIPLKLLVCGMKAANTSGTATQDAEVDSILDVATADALHGVGGQLTRAEQIALRIPGVQVWGAPVAVPSGATAASIQITFSANAVTKQSTYTLRLAGVPISISIGTSDTVATIASNLASAINNVMRLPMTASAAAGVVTITVITPGAWGNSLIAFQDLSQCSGLTVYFPGPTWAAATTYALNSFILPKTANGFYFKATAISGTGTSGATEPTWPTTIGTTVVDNTGANQITWTCWGQVVTGNGITFANGTGVENVANILTYIASDTFDRIAILQNDATNLGRWKSQVDAQAGALTQIFQHAVTGSNGTITAATSLAQTTLNDERFQHLWMLNGETPWTEMVAVFAAIRTQAEQNDPNASYDNVVLPGVAPQSQRADWPTHATLVSALNNGVTPVTTKNGAAVIVRSITTKSLNGTTPDYATLDTAAAVVPDFALKSLLLYWTTVFLPANPRVAPDLLTNQRRYPEGVGYPALWSSCATSVLRDLEQGKIGGTQVAPILINVDGNLPVSTYDPIAGRIMSAVTVVPAPNQHQIGVSVSQSNGQ